MIRFNRSLLALCIICIWYLYIVRNRNVQCYDTVEGAQCGDCPVGYSGNGRQCTLLNACHSNPCASGTISQQSHGIYQMPVFQFFTCFVLLASSRCLFNSQCNSHVCFYHNIIAFISVCISFINNRFCWELNLKKWVEIVLTNSKCVL